MLKLANLLTELCDVSEHPGMAVQKTMRERKRRAVGCFPLYTPDELVDAAGFLPVGMWGGKTVSPLVGKYVQSFCCSVMKANLGQALEGQYHMLSAVIIPTYCDTLKCICENWKAAVKNIPAIPMVYPQNGQTEAGLLYLEEEFKRIKDKLEALSGQKIEEEALERSYEKFEKARLQMREFTRLASLHPDIISVKTRHKVLKAGYFLDKADYEKKLSVLNQELEKLPKNPKQCSIRVVVTGLMLEPDVVLDAFDSHSVCIAADDLSQESRSFRVAGTAQGDVYRKMACRFMSQTGDPFICEPQKIRGDRLIQMVKDNAADGVVAVMMKFCDPEEFDYPIYKKELERAGIPLLFLELEQTLDAAEGIATRLEGFAEMLQ